MPGSCCLTTAPTKDFAIAGRLAMNLETSAIETAVGLSDDLGTGLIDRFRTLPMWKPAVLVGRSLTDLLTATPVRADRGSDRSRDRLAAACGHWRCRSPDTAVGDRKC